jgi:hypothetical protein
MMTHRGVHWRVINVIYAVKYFPSGMVSSDIFAYTIREHTNVRLVINFLHEVTILMHTEEFTQVRNRMLVKCAISVLHTEVHKEIISLRILEVSRTSVKYARKLSLAEIHYICITVSTQETILINVRCVIRISYAKKT